jgi:hypothetical protein
MVAHPHGEQQPDVTNPVNGKHLDGIFYRQVTFTVKGDEKEGGDPQNFPSHKKRFEVSGKNGEAVAQVKEKDGIEKPFVPLFPVQIRAAVHDHHKTEEGPYGEIGGSNFIEVKANLKNVFVVLVDDDFFDVQVFMPG